MDSAALTVKPDDVARDGDPTRLPTPRGGTAANGTGQLGGVSNPVKTVCDRRAWARLGNAASTASEQPFKAGERGAESGNGPSVVQAGQP